MKKLISTLLFALLVTAAFAQHCATPSGPNECTPDNNAQVGFPDNDSIPCLVRSGVDNQVVIKFKNYSTFNAPIVGTVAINWMRFDSIENLPCGICWSTNVANNQFAADDPGCIKFTGMTNDAVGQYRLRVTITADIVGLGQQTVNLEAGGIRVYARVKDAVSDNCTAVDTSAVGNQQNLANCATGINDESLVHGVNVVPNPFSSSATLSFVAEKSGTVQVKLLDMIGQEVYATNVAAHAGENNVDITRNNLPAGFYFVTVNDGISNVTKRISIGE